MPSDVEDIKNRLDLGDLIGEYVKLTPAGVNFKANCPFHNEKTASFIVSPDKQIWHCFGCGKGGDHFSFIQQLEGLEFPEALRVLAARAGVKLEYRNPEQHNHKTRLLDLNKAIMEHWQNLLAKDPSAQLARDYLQQRQLKEETIKQFCLGYGLEAWDSAVKFLQSKGFTLKEMADAGITVVGEKGRPYDRFRGRLIFPIRDVHGNVVGFTARKLKEEDHGGKYVNSPQTEIYNKSQILYNLDLAKTEIKRLNYAILVEGNMDAIACYQAGTKNAVAISGTALTPEQIKLLKRYTQNVMIAFDADPAGVQANLRGIDLAWQAGLNVKVISMISGKDPDELIRENPDKWRESVKGAYNFMDYAFVAILQGLDLARVDHKKTAAKKILPLIRNLGDEVEKSHYLRKLADILGVNEESLANTLSAIKVAPSLQPIKEKTRQSEEIDHNRTLAEHLLALLVKFPHQLKEVAQHLEPAMLNYQPAARLYTELIIHYNKNHHLPETELLKDFDSEQPGYLDQLFLLVGEEFINPTPDLLNHEILSAVKRLKDNHIRARLQHIAWALKQAEQAGQTDEVSRLIQESTNLSRQLK
ncbi:MAG: DNA primase [Patescibacteria group bacterium]|jgi:DNA primase